MSCLKFIIFSFYLFTSVYSQTDSVEYVQYSSDFKFKEGIYLNFIQAKNNTPVPKSRIQATIDYDNPYYFDKILEKNKIVYFDLLGSKQEVSIKNIWGYSNDGKIYIQVYGKFYRISYIGSICHFIAIVESYRSSYYSDPYYGGRNYTPTSDTRQYIFNFKTGDLLIYNVANIEVLLMEDKELYDEYMALKRRKKKQLMFMYIRKFNERNPLMFPKNTKN